MEALNYPKTDYLLDASLASLHEQSLEWLKDLAFWSDEMTFFYHILHDKKLSGSFPPSQVAEIEKELVRLNGDVLDRLRTEVGSHERLLAAVYRAPSVTEDQAYRDAHGNLFRRVRALDGEVRGFKSKLFAFVRQ